MLAEFATHTFPPSACSAPMSGVTVWRFDGGLANAHLPLQLAPQLMKLSSVWTGRSPSDARASAPSWYRRRTSFYSAAWDHCRWHKPPLG